MISQILTSLAILPGKKDTQSSISRSRYLGEARCLPAFPVRTRIPYEIKPYCEAPPFLTLFSGTPISNTFFGEMTVLSESALNLL